LIFIDTLSMPRTLPLLLSVPAMCTIGFVGMMGEFLVLNEASRFHGMLALERL